MELNGEVIGCSTTRDMKPLEQHSAKYGGGGAEGGEIKLMEKVFENDGEKVTEEWINSH
jgi:hypothetical protein